MIRLDLCAHYDVLRPANQAVEQRHWIVVGAARAGQQSLLLRRAVGTDSMVRFVKLQ